MVKSSEQIKKELELIQSMRIEQVRTKENLDLSERNQQIISQEEQSPQESEGIIDALFTGIVEGASDVYDNTVGQIMGDEPNQEKKDEKENKKENLTSSDKDKKKDKGIIDGLWQGVKEGASDVYDNTVGQIMGDEPNQEKKDEKEKNKSLDKKDTQISNVSIDDEEQEKEKEDKNNQTISASIHQNMARPKKVSENITKTEETNEQADYHHQIRSLTVQAQTNDEELRLNKYNSSLIQECRNNDVSNETEQKSSAHTDEIQKSMMQNQGR